MALQTFWTSVRRAIHPYADAPTLTASQLEQELRQAIWTTWLTTRSVGGFDPVDFDFMPEAERDRLAGLVRDFRAVASEVTPNAPATAAQVERAVPLFRGIVETLAFDRFGDAHAYRLGKQIEEAIASRRPPQLVELRFRTGFDHAGEPGLFIWVLLADEDDESFLARSKDLLELLSDAARDVAPELFPFINFHSVADQHELPKAGAV